MYLTKYFKIFSTTNLKYWLFKTILLNYIHVKRTKHEICGLNGVNIVMVLILEIIIQLHGLYLLAKMIEL